MDYSSPYYRAANSYLGRGATNSNIQNAMNNMHNMNHTMHNHMGNTMNMPMGNMTNTPMNNTMDMQTNDQYEPRTAMAEALRTIQDAVNGEAEDRLFYEYLISQAPCEEEKKIIMGIRDNEIKHFGMFRQFYYELTGTMLPQSAEVTFEKPASYCAGLQQALMGEQNAVAKYRKILFALQNRRHINMITEIITDELRHLGLYNYLFAKNKCTE